MTDEAHDELAAAVHDLAAPIAEQLGVEVLDVTVRGTGGRRLVRITADARELDADAALDIDVIADLSRRVSAVLDERDPIDGGYTLEVTSPGADRPLERPRDFARNVGRDVRVQRIVDGEVTSFTGELTSASHIDITLRHDRDELVIPLGEIEHAQVVLPW